MYYDLKSAMKDDGVFLLGGQLDISLGGASRDSMLVQNLQHHLQQLRVERVKVKHVPDNTAYAF